MVGHQNWSLFIVFDGHAGVKSARFLETALAEQLEKETKVSYSSGFNYFKSIQKIDDMNYKDKEIKEAITKAFIDTDVKLRKHLHDDYEADQSGATCVAKVSILSLFLDQFNSEVSLGDK